MKNLELKKIEINTKVVKYKYEVYEDGFYLCERKTNRNYVACYVYKYKDTYNAPFFFGRMDLIGKGDSRHAGQGAYGLAKLKEKI